jgi:hypothetical protein
MANGIEKMGAAAIDVAAMQAILVDLVGAGIVDPASAGGLTPAQVSNVHLDARARGTAGIRPLDKLLDDVVRLIEAAEVRAMDRRHKGKAA